MMCACVHVCAITYVLSHTILWACVRVRTVVCEFVSASASMWSSIESERERERARESERGRERESERERERERGRERERERERVCV